MWLGKGPCAVVALAHGAQEEGGMDKDEGWLLGLGVYTAGGACQDAGKYVCAFGPLPEGACSCEPTDWGLWALMEELHCPDDLARCSSGTAVRNTG